MSPEDFLKANQAAQQVQAPTTGGSEVQNYFNGAFQNNAIASASSQGATALRADDEERKRRAAYEEQQAAAKNKLDPSKYQRVRKDDGGFAFFNPEGKEIDVDTYAKLTGQRRTDAIKDSENPVDIQFENDWAEANDFAQAIYKNDTETINEFKDYYPGLFKKGNPKPEEIYKTMLQRYPHMFGMGNYQTSKNNLGNPVFRMGGDSSAPGGGFQR